ncbi:unnamed protein product [Parajaminaea phylloscopi]
MYYQGAPTPEIVSRVYRQLSRQSQERTLQHARVGSAAPSDLDETATLHRGGETARFLGEAWKARASSVLQGDEMASKPAFRLPSREDMDWLLSVSNRSTGRRPRPPRSQTARQRYDEREELGPVPRGDLEGSGDGRTPTAPKPYLESPTSSSMVGEQLTRETVPEQEDVPAQHAGNPPSAEDEGRQHCDPSPPGASTGSREDQAETEGEMLSSPAYLPLDAADVAVADPPPLKAVNANEDAAEMTAPADPADPAKGSKEAADDSLSGAPQPSEEAEEDLSTGSAELHAETAVGAVPYPDGSQKEATHEALASSATLRTGIADIAKSDRAELQMRSTSIVLEAADALKLPAATEQLRTGYADQYVTVGDVAIDFSDRATSCGRATSPAPWEQQDFEEAHNATDPLALNEGSDFSLSALNDMPHSELIHGMGAQGRQASETVQTIDPFLMMQGTNYPSNEIDEQGGQVNDDGPPEKSAGKQPVELRRWWLRLSNHARDLSAVRRLCGKNTPVKHWIYVEGIKTTGFGADLWHSSIITARLKADLVQTVSGGCYHLEGTLDQAMTRSHGVPDEIIAAFAQGFPVDWLQLLAAELTGLAGVGEGPSIESSQAIEASQGGRAREIRDKDGVSDHEASASDREASSRALQAHEETTMVATDDCISSPNASIASRREAAELSPVAPSRNESPFSNLPAQEAVTAAVWRPADSPPRLAQAHSPSTQDSKKKARRQQISAQPSASLSPRRSRVSNELSKLGRSPFGRLRAVKETLDSLTQESAEYHRQDESSHVSQALPQTPQPKGSDGKRKRSSDVSVARDHVSAPSIQSPSSASVRRSSRRSQPGSERWWILPSGEIKIEDADDIPSRPAQGDDDGEDRGSDSPTVKRGRHSVQEPRLLTERLAHSQSSENGVGGHNGSANTTVGQACIDEAAHSHRASLEAGSPGPRHRSLRSHDLADASLGPSSPRAQALPLELSADTLAGRRGSVVRAADREINTGDDEVDGPRVLTKTRSRGKSARKKASGDKAL